MNTEMMSKTTMTSSELLSMLHFKSKSSLNRSIREMFADKISTGAISASVESIGLNAGSVNEYHLPELESKMFVAKHDINYLEKITQYWIDKAPKPMSQLTTLELCDLIRSTELARLAEVQKYEALNIEFLNVMEEEGFYQFITVSKLLAKVGLGRTTLMGILRDKNILLDSNLPAQSQVDNGRFVVKRYYLKEVEKHCTTTLVTEKGFLFLAQMFHEWVKPIEIPLLEPSSAGLCLVDNSHCLDDWFNLGWTRELLIDRGHAFIKE